MIFGEGLVVKALKNQSKDTKTANLEVCNEEGDLDFGSPSKGPLEAKSLSDLSF